LSGTFTPAIRAILKVKYLSPPPASECREALTEGWQGAAARAATAGVGTLPAVLELFLGTYSLHAQSIKHIQFTRLERAPPGRALAKRLQLGLS
jgi:hypothetical protein